MSAVLDYLKEKNVLHEVTEHKVVYNMTPPNRVYVRSALYANLKANCILLPQKPKTFTNSFWKIRAWKFLP